jgi:hypothetical protein
MIPILGQVHITVISLLIKLPVLITCGILAHRITNGLYLLLSVQVLEAGCRISPLQRDAQMVLMPLKLEPYRLAHVHKK